MELQSENSKRRRMRFFGSRRSSSIGSNISFKSAASAISFSSADSGSKDENFFEAKNFESDADDDFHSVQGDSTTPSGTATPNGYIRTASSNLSRSASVAPAGTNDGKESATSNDQKVKLADLLKEEQDSIEQEPGAQSSNGIKIEKLSSIASRGSSLDETPSEAQVMKQRSYKVAPCCLPCLVFTSCSKDKRKIKTENGS